MSEKTDMEKYSEVKVKTGWFLFCPIMIFEGKIVPRKLAYKYLFLAAIWIKKVIKVILYFIGFNKVKTKLFLKLTGENTIYIEKGK